MFNIKMLKKQKEYVLWIGFAGLMLTLLVALGACGLIK